MIRRLGEGGERGSFDRAIVQSNGAATERQRIGNGSDYSVWMFLQLFNELLAATQLIIEVSIPLFVRLLILLFFRIFIELSIRWLFRLFCRLSVRLFIRLSIRLLSVYAIDYSLDYSIEGRTADSTIPKPQQKKAKEPQRTRAFAMQALRFSKKMFMSWGLACLHFHAPKSMQGHWILAVWS